MVLQKVFDPIVQKGAFKTTWTRRGGSVEKFT